MSDIEYKNFKIGFGQADQKYFVVADGFNPEGYATMNNAKGAITKHIKARDEKHDKGMEVLAQRWKEQDAQKANKAASSDDVSHASVSIKPVKHMSRNKREGRFVGCTDGKPFRVRFACPVYSEKMFPRTRKQRKLIEINSKNKQK